MLVAHFHLLLYNAYKLPYWTLFFIFLFLSRETVAEGLKDIPVLYQWIQSFSMIMDYYPYILGKLDSGLALPMPKLLPFFLMNSRLPFLLKRLWIEIQLLGDSNVHNNLNNLNCLFKDHLLGESFVILYCTISVVMTPYSFDNQAFLHCLRNRISYRIGIPVKRIFILHYKQLIIISHTVFLNENF